MFALLVCACVLLAWSTSNSFARPTKRFDHKSPERFWWMTERMGPAWADERLHDADVIFVGDSRIKSGLDLPLIRSLGLPKASKIWGGGANTATILRPLLEWERPRALVLAMTPLGFKGNLNKHVGETLRVAHPATDPNAKPWQIRQWGKEEREHLVQAGFEPVVADFTIQWWNNKYREVRRDHLDSQRWLNTAGIDDALNGFFDRYRSLYLRPIEPIEWEQSWFRIEKPERSDEMYAGVLSKPNLADMEAGAQDLEQTLRALRDRGWRIAIVRMPIEPNLREIEDQSHAAPIYDRLVQELNLPLKDFGAWPGATWDGSHLHLEGADRATHEIAEWVHGIWPDL
ncbi:MAG: hypothetical protein KDB61_04635 [Planctomycetes bacterium]|nr:hypothetical protein [Planctomycetota bacterium]